MSEAVDRSYFEDEVRDGFLIPSMMKRFWARNLSAYLVLERVCEESGLHCSAMWGTLLGAVRHGGYIPWDDDIDLEMKHCEYSVLERLNSENKLPDDYWISDYVFTEQENMVRRWMSSKSLIEKYDKWEDNYGSPFVAILDIFIQEYIPSGEQEDRYWEMMEKAGAMKEEAKKLDPSRLHPEFNKRLRLLEKELSYEPDNRVKKPLFIKILQAMDAYCLSYNRENCDRLGIPAYYRRNPARIIPDRLYDHYIRMDFEYSHIEVPAGYDGILRRYFGRYMVPVLDFGIHGYPAYEAMNADAKKVGGFELSEYRFDKDELDRILSGITDKIPLHDELAMLVPLFKDAHSYIYDCLSENSITEELIDVLAQCQELAITAGQSIEDRAVGGTKYVKLFEDYCEDAFVIHQMLSGQAEIDNDLLSEKYARMTAFVPYFEMVSDGIEEKKKVLFLSYKSSNWHYLHGLWKAASADDGVIISVISVPYYLKDYKLQTDRTDMIYKTDDYPDEVLLTPYDQYDLEAERPDVIIYQMPYDEFGGATSVHPYFYSSNIRKYTDKLVLIPPFKLREIGKNSVQARYTLGTFLKNRGVLLSDRIVVQSDGMGETCLEILSEFTSDGDLPEMIAGGDLSSISIVDGKHDNNHDRIRLVYVLGGSMLYEYGMHGIEKAKKALNFISSMDDIEIIWYDDKYAEDILRDNLPEVWDEYVKLRADHKKQEDIVPIDCDAIYGDGCVLMNEFRMAGKPVLWETPGAEIVADERDTVRDIKAVPVAVEGDGEDEWSVGEFMESVRRSVNSCLQSDDVDFDVLWKDIKREYKTVAIVYEAPVDSKLADGVEAEIKSMKRYEVIRCPLDGIHTMEEQYGRMIGHGSQLVITLNLAGFDYRNTGGNSSYSMLGCDSFHYINRDIDEEEKLLSGLLPITMRFITDSKERRDGLLRNYRKIHYVDVDREFPSGLHEMIDKLNWRK